MATLSGLKRPLDADDSREVSRKRQSFDEDHKHPVDVVVGEHPETERFHCFAPLLERSSRYFRAKLQDNQVSPGHVNPLSYSIPVLYLSHERPADFSLFRKYMESPRFFSSASEVRKKRAFDLVRLYCFADRMGALKLKNLIINCLYLKALDSFSQPQDARTHNGQDLLQNVINSWKRIGRWVSCHQEIQPERSGLYKFITDFFAFHVLQVVRSHEEKVLSDLPNSFLWHILRALKAALVRHEPSMQKFSTKSTSSSTPSRITTMTTDSGKTVTVVQLDSDDEKGNLSVPAHEDIAPRPKTALEEEEAFSKVPKSDIIDIIIFCYSLFRSFANGRLVRTPPPKKRGRPPTTTTKENQDSGDDNSDDGSSVGDMEEKGHISAARKNTKKRVSKKTAFFGVEDLCGYHEHTSESAKKTCKQTFFTDGPTEVWPLTPLLPKAKK